MLAIRVDFSSESLCDSTSVQFYKWQDFGVHDRMKGFLLKSAGEKGIVERGSWKQGTGMFGSQWNRWTPNLGSLVSQISIWRRNREERQCQEGWSRCTVVTYKQKVNTCAAKVRKLMLTVWWSHRKDKSYSHCVFLTYRIKSKWTECSKE